jgi:hypothetical protein
MALLAGGIEAGIESWDFLGGLLGGLLDCVAGGELAQPCFAFFNWRFSLRLRGMVGVVNAIAESASLSSGSGDEVCGISRSAAGVCRELVGLVTCARVDAFDMIKIYSKFRVEVKESDSNVG